MSDPWKSELSCPICGTEDFIFPIGPRKSPILVIGGKPSPNDIKHSRPFTEGEGTVLRQEFAYYGIDTKAFRITYLWTHPENKNKKCLEKLALDAIKEAKDRKLIILISAETVKYFTHLSVEDVMGLQITSQFFTAPIFCMESLGSIFNRGGVVGEMKLAIKKISRYIEKEGILK